MKRARIATLHTAAKSRPTGYLEACLAAGKISPDGQWLIFSDTAHNALRAKYNPALHALTSARSNSSSTSTSVQSTLRSAKASVPCPDPRRFPCGRSAP
jgi:hypothetical protein